MKRCGARRRLFGALLGFACVLAGSQAEGRPRHHRFLRGCCGYAPDADPFDTDVPPPFVPEEAPSFVVPPGFGPESEPPFVPDASPRPGPAPYPQGFVLDVPIKPEESDRNRDRPSTQLTSYRQVADTLAACWRPPAEFGDRPWRQVTLRVSFKRDGTINGMPRIPYTDEGLTPEARSDLRTSLMAALNACLPLPLSPSLGSAVAGQIFALRFIEQDQD